jgi:hypothetical protein
MAPRDGDGGVISSFERLRTEFNALRDGNKHRQDTLNIRLVSENVQLSKQNAEIVERNSDITYLMNHAQICTAVAQKELATLTDQSLKGPQPGAANRELKKLLVSETAKLQNHRNSAPDGAKLAALKDAWAKKNEANELAVATAAEQLRKLANQNDDEKREAQIRCDDLKSLSHSQDSMLRGLQKQILNVVQETAELTKAYQTKLQAAATVHEPDQSHVAHSSSSKIAAYKQRLLFLDREKQTLLRAGRNQGPSGTHQRHPTAQSVTHFPVRNDSKYELSEKFDTAIIKTTILKRKRVSPTDLAISHSAEDAIEDFGKSSIDDWQAKPEDGPRVRVKGDLAKRANMPPVPDEAKLAATEKRARRRGFR